MDSVAVFRVDIFLRDHIVGPSEGPCMRSMNFWLTRHICGRELRFL